MIGCKNNSWKRFKQLSNPRKSLRARICLVAGIATFILWAVLVVLVVVITTTRLKKDGGTILANFAAAMSESIDKELYERLNEVQAFGRFPVYPQVLDGINNFEQVRFALELARQSNDYYTWVGVLALNGTVLASTPDNILEGLSFANTSVFTKGLKGPYAGNLYTLSGAFVDQFPAFANQTLHVLDFSAPIINYETNETVGVILAYVNWLWVREVEASLYPFINKPTELFIFNASSTIALAPPGYTYSYSSGRVPLPWLKSYLASDKQSTYFSTDEWVSKENISVSVPNRLMVGVSKCTGYKEFAGLPWVIAVTVPENVITDPIVTLRDQTIAGGVVFWFILSLSMIILASQIVSPLTHTSEVASMLLGGEISWHSMEDCAKDQDALLNKMWMRDEVYTQCKIVRLLARTLAQQRYLAQTMEQRVADRTKHLQLEIQFREKVQVSAEQAKLSAEAAEAAKTRFLANMSHEIRTPMNGILGTIQLLLETPLLEDQHDYVRTMKYSADSLLSIINDVLMFSKLESNHFQLRASAFQMDHVFEGVGELLGPLCGEKRLGLYFIVDPNVPESLVGDYGRLQQVLINLAGNSLKFTSYPGEIVCSTGCSTCYLRSIFNANDDSPFQHGGGLHTCSKSQVSPPSLRKLGEDGAEEREDTEDGPVFLDEEEDGVMLEFEVRDTGCGISKEQIGRLFTPFFQADSSTTRSTGGTGLGLSICKQLVELFGGKVAVNSIVGTGSSFHFTSYFKIPSLAMLRTASLLSRRAIEKSQFSNNSSKSLAIASNSSNKTINTLVKTLSNRSYNSDTNTNNTNNNNNNSNNSNNNNNSSPSSSRTTSPVITTDDPKNSALINLMVTTTSNRQTFAALLGNIEAGPYGQSESNNNLDLPSSPALDFGSDNPLKKSDYETHSDLETSIPESSVLVTADRETFQKIIAYRMVQAFPNIRCETTSASGKDLAEVILKGHGGKPYNAVIMYNSNYDTLLNSVEAMLNMYSPKHHKSTGLIAMCPMGASIVRKKLTSYGIRHLPTPLCLPKLVKVIDSMLRDGFKAISHSPDDLLALRPTYSTSANVMRAGYDEGVANALSRNLIPIPGSPQQSPLHSPHSPLASPGRLLVPSFFHSSSSSSSSSSNSPSVFNPLLPNSISRSPPASQRRSFHGTSSENSISASPSLSSSSLMNTPVNSNIRLPLGIILPISPLTTSSSNMSTSTSGSSFQFTPSTSSPGTPTGSFIKRPSLRVLVAEDNKTNMMILTKYLQKTGTGVKVFQSNDGAEAVAEVTNHPLGFFNLILMDLHMPNVDGLQATKQIRKWEREQLEATANRPRVQSVGTMEDAVPLLELQQQYKDSAHGRARASSASSRSPHAQTQMQTQNAHAHAQTQAPKRLRIIALTADVMPGVSEECEAAGMDGFLTKPLDYRQLSKVIHEINDSLNNSGPS